MGCHSLVSARAAQEVLGSRMKEKQLHSNC